MLYLLKNGSLVLLLQLIMEIAESAISSTYLGKVWYASLTIWLKMKPRTTSHCVNINEIKIPNGEIYLYISKAFDNASREHLKTILIYN